MTLAIIQARLTSKRLPRKILKKINGKSMLYWVIEAAEKASGVEMVCVASPHRIPGLDTAFYIGSENDVLDRFYKCAKFYEADIIVRLTSDCPMVDHNVITYAIKYLKKNKMRYVCFAPVDGLDIEVFNFDMLKEAWENTTDKSDREHVTPYMKRVTKLSVDTTEDLKRVREYAYGVA